MWYDGYQGIKHHAKEHTMRIEVTARMVVEIPDEKIGVDGTIIGSETWQRGPTKPEDHVADSMVFYTASTIARSQSRSPYKARVTKQVAR